MWGVGIKRKVRKRQVAVVDEEKKEGVDQEPEDGQAGPKAGEASLSRAAKFAFQPPPPGARPFRTVPTRPPVAVKEEETFQELGPDDEEPPPPAFGSPYTPLKPSEASWEKGRVKDWLLYTSDVAEE